MVVSRLPRAHKARPYQAVSQPLLVELILMKIELWSMISPEFESIFLC